MSDTNEEGSDNYDDLEGWYLDDDDYELFVKDLRDEARYWAKEAEENFRYYRTSLKSGEQEMAKLFYEEGIYCRKYMKDCNDDAAEIAFEINNEYRTLDTIDLHHLFVGEAITKLTDRVNGAVRTNMRKLTVIVGRGYHSEYGPKLSAAVASFATENKIPYTFDFINPGRIVLRLEDASEVRSHENEFEHSESSPYIYNRANKVSLSEYVVQTQEMKQAQRSKNKKKRKQRTNDCSNEFPPNVKQTENLKQNEKKCIAQNVIDRLNKIPSSLDHQNRQKTKLMTQRRVNDDPSNVRRTQNLKPNERNCNAIDRTNEIFSSSMDNTNRKKTKSRTKQTANGRPNNYNHPSNVKRTEMQNVTDRSKQNSTLSPNESGTEIRLLIFYFLYYLIGGVLIAKLC